MDGGGEASLPKNQLCGLQPDTKLLQILGHWTERCSSQVIHAFFFFLIHLKFELVIHAHDNKSQKATKAYIMKTQPSPPKNNHF